MKEILHETLQAVLPLAALVLILQVAVLAMPLAIVIRFLVGVVMVMAGLLLFLKGVRLGLLPMGQAIGAELPKRVSFGILLVLAFALAFAATVAEPDVRVPAAILEAGDLGNPGTGVAMDCEE